jgi:hypothetical protein
VIDFQNVREETVKEEDFFSLCDAIFSIQIGQNTGSTKIRLEAICYDVLLRQKETQMLAVIANIRTCSKTSSKNTNHAAVSSRKR